MNNHCIGLNRLPTSNVVAGDLSTCFEDIDIDFRDIAHMARQDPVIFANIMLMVNKVISKQGSRAVNSLSAAINLVGLEPLKETILSIETLDEHDAHFSCYALIKDRIYVAACLTQYWAEYTGQTLAEEMFCASMFTGLGDLAYCLECQDVVKHSQVDIDSIDTIRSLYINDHNEVEFMPDSIQVIYHSGILTERLKLSVLVYELVCCLEYGYTTEQLKQALLNLCDYIGIGIHRAGYDLARHLVEIERASDYHIYNHSQFLVATNIEPLDPIVN